MRFEFWWRRAPWLCAATLLAVGPSVVKAEPVDQRPADREQKERLEGEPGGVFSFGGEVTLDTTADGKTHRLVVGPRGVALRERAPQGDYWLGLECSAVDEALRAQLDVPENQGLVVRQIVDGSPAAKSDVKAHDILLTANDKPLGEVHDLQAVVEAAKDSEEIKITALRGGKETKYTLKAAKRPEGDRPGPAEREGDRETILRFFGDRPPHDVMKVRPGVMLRHDMLRQTLPDNMKLTIVREGSKPAKITVERGDEKWEVTSEKLGDLPEDVRRAVLPAMMMPPMGPVPFTAPLPGPGREGPRGDHDVEMQRRLQRLEQAVQELHRRGGDRGPGDRGPGDRGPGNRGPGDRGPGDRGPGERGPGERGRDRGELRRPGDRDEGPRGEGRREGPRDGEARREGPRDGEVRREGPRDGGLRREGPRDGEPRRPGPRDGDARREGPRDGETRKEGPRDGDSRRQDGDRSESKSPEADSEK